MIDFFDTIFAILKYIGLSILVLLGFIIFGLLMQLPTSTCHKGETIYEYEDLNGNIGTAYYCDYTDKDTYSGGMGEPICKTDNKVIAVKWYEDKTEYMSCKKYYFGG